MHVIKRNIEKVWGARYTLGARYLYIIRDAGNVWGARYLPKNTASGRTTFLTYGMCLIVVMFLQIEVHRSESLDPGPSCLEVETTIAKLKKV
jgi:hypothetical protein